MFDYSEGFFDRKIKATMIFSIIFHLGVFYFNEAKRTSELVSRIDNIEFIDQTLAPSIRPEQPQKSIFKAIKDKITQKEDGIKELDNNEIEKIVRALPPVPGISEKGIELDQKQLDRTQAKGIDLDKFERLEGPEGGASEILRVASGDRQSSTEDIISKPAIKISEEKAYSPDAKIGIFSSPGGSGPVDLEKVPTKELEKMAPVKPSDEEAKIKKAPTKSTTKITISGPLSSRQITYKPTTPYPVWAQERGLTATISVQIAVNPNGTVKDNVFVIRTSGFGSWDRLVIDSVRQWKFAAIQGSGIVQTGIITFTFVLE
ncbi:TonB family protein [candidate division WOR-3 bacterium]|nr:TonB family protein [candidate division WOR-3 bacterium]